MKTSMSLHRHRALLLVGGCVLTGREDLTSTTYGAFSLVFELEPLLLLHELPNTHGEVSVELVVPEILGDFGARLHGIPVGFGSATIVVHAGGWPVGVASTTDSSGWRCRTGSRRSSFLGSEATLCFGVGACPLFHLVPVGIPHAVDAAAHTAVVGFVRARWNQNAGD